MNWEIEITLNTNIQRFESWFDRYRLETLPFIDNLDDEKTLHVIGGASFRREHSGKREHEIRAAIGKQDPSKPDTEVLSFPFPVLRLDVFEPAENKSIATIVCLHPGLWSYFLSFLQEITHLWPETQKSIIDFLMQFIPEDERRKFNETIPGLKDASSIFISQIALNTTGVSTTGYEEMPRKVLEEKAARFDVMRHGETSLEKIQIRDKTDISDGDFTTEKKKNIDRACIRWAGREYLTFSNMSEYLQEFYNETEIYLSVDQFKKALRDAGRRGLIVKKNRRWRSP